MRIRVLVLVVGIVFAPSSSYAQAPGTVPAVPGNPQNERPANASQEIPFPGGGGSAAGRGRGRFNREPLEDPETAEAHRKERAKLAMELLQLSYAMGTEMPAYERSKVLPRQVQTASSMDTDLGAKWAEEALQFALEVPPGAERDALYGSALPALVSSDPKNALEIFRTLPAETTQSGAFAFATQSLFTRLVREQQAEGMEQVRLEAQRLSQVGYYPHAAVMAAVRELHTGDNALREAFFQEAVSSYRQGNRLAAGDEDFVRMLMFESRGQPRAAVQQAFQALTDNLLARAQREESAVASSSASSATSPPVRDSADLLLRRMLPLLQRFDPEMRNKVVQTRPSVASGGRGRGGFGPGMFPPGGPAGSSASGSQQQIQDQRQSALQFNQARRNPAGALTASTAIADPLGRTMALVGAASGMVGKDPAGAATTLEQALRASERITDPFQQMQAANAMIGVTGQIENAGAFRSVLEKGFQSAEALQQTGDETDARRAQGSLQMLVRRAFQQDSALTLAFVDQVRTPAMKATLLLDGAQALLQRDRRQEFANRGRGRAPSPNGEPPPAGLAPLAP